MVADRAAELSVAHHVTGNAAHDGAFDATLRVCAEDPSDCNADCQRHGEHHFMIVLNLIRE